MHFDPMMMKHVRNTTRERDNIKLVPGTYPIFFPNKDSLSFEIATKHPNEMIEIETEAIETTSSETMYVFTVFCLLNALECCYSLIVLFGISFTFETICYQSRSFRILIEINY